MDEIIYKEIYSQLTEIKVSIAALPEKILEKTDKRYAAMWVQRAMQFIFGAVAVIIVGALMSVIVVRAYFGG